MINRVMDIEQFKSDLKVYSIEEMYNRYLISGDVWIMKRLFGEEWHEKYDEFKLYISDRLLVHFNDIAIAGSAKTGFSINPNKNYKVFDDCSDIDVIIVSQKLFYRFWDAYISDSYAEIRTPYFRTVCFSVFRRYVNVEYLSKSNKEYISWTKQTEGFEKDLQFRFLIENDIHYRIYESWDSAKYYYMNGIKKLKDRLETV